MNRKALSFSAVVTAAAVAAAPLSGVANAAPASLSAVIAQQTTTSAIVQNVSDATGAKAALTAASSSAAPSGAGVLVLATKDQRVYAPQLVSTVAAPTVTAIEAPVIDLPGVPPAITDFLDLLGLPLQAVWKVVEVGQGIYTVFYDLLSSIPNAIITGRWGSIPGLLTEAATTIVTWLTTGAGPVVEEEPTAPAPSSATLAAPTVAADVAAVPTLDLPLAFTELRNLITFPIKIAEDGVKTLQTVYSSGYGLLSSVPNAILTGRWGSVPELVISAIEKSFQAIVDYPVNLYNSASDSVANLVDALTPRVRAAEPVTTTTAESPAGAKSVAALAVAEEVQAPPKVQSEVKDAATPTEALVTSDTGKPAPEDPKVVTDQAKTLVKSAPEKTPETSSKVADTAPAEKAEAPTVEKEAPVKDADTPAKSTDASKDTNDKAGSTKDQGSTAN